MAAITDALTHVLQQCLLHGSNLKAYVTIRVLMHKIYISNGKVMQEDRSHFSSKATPIQVEADIEEFLQDVSEKLTIHIDRFTQKGSNWIVAAIEQVSIHLVKYKLLKGGASDGFELPKDLANKKCVLNIELKDDNSCLKFAIVAAIHHGEIQHNKVRRHLYEKFLPNYDFSTISYPATTEDLVRFQKANKAIAINALLYIAATEDKPASVMPIYHPPHDKVINRQIVNILLVK